MGSNIQRSPGRNVYIFQKDHDTIGQLVLYHPERETRGNLFGLWTTDGEPVVHIICGQSYCKEIVSDLAGITWKDFPLCHIGNWRYNDSTERLRRGSRHAADYPRCIHKTEGRFLDLTVSIVKSTYRVTAYLSGLQERSSPAVEGKVEILPAESPFKNVKGIKEMAIEWPSSLVSTGYSSPKKQSHTSPGKAAAFTKYDETVDEVPAVTGAKQSRVMYPTRSQSFQSHFASGDFNVVMFEEDYRRMQKLVLEYPHLETGGDLFGLWTSNGEAVLHVVLGPGRDCKRTGASFYQDIPYLQRNGELLTQKYMLCHIGEWHSHHQLRLFQPSHGDSSTVIRNYPRGTCGFLLIIANIVSPSEVTLSPYLYTEKSTHGFDKMGKIVRLPNKNAFNNIREIKTSTESGRDVKVYPQYPQAGFSYSRYSPPSPPPRARDVKIYSPPRPRRVSVPNRTTTRIQSQSTKQPWR